MATTSDLEGADLLEVLALEEQVTTREVVESGARHDRRPMANDTDALLCFEDIA